MSDRGRRDELIVVFVLVVIAVGIAIGGVLSQSGGSDLPEDAPSPAAGEPSATPTPSSPSTSADPEEPEEPANPGVTVWDQQFVYACRLLPTDDVARIFGPSGQKGYVRQQYLDRTPTAAELSGASAFSYGGLATRCTHWFDDLAGHQLDVVVTQFRSEDKARKRWAALTESRGKGARRHPAAGRVVPGSDGRLLHLAADRSYVTRTGSLTVELTYSSDRRDRTDQVPLMREVVDAIDEHRADGTATEGPVPTREQLSGTVGGTPYVEPCTVLDGLAYAALDGPPSEPVVVDTSVIAHDVFADAAVSSCERSGTFRGDGPRKVRSTFAVLEIRVTPDPASAQAALERHLAERYPKGTEVTEIETDPGPAYVVDLGGLKHNPLHTRAVHVVVGAYELRLAAVGDVGPQRKSGRAPTDAELAQAVDALAAAMP